MRPAVLVTATVLALAAGAFAIAFSGVYNVAATTRHLPPVRWFLTFGMQQSAKFHAAGIEAPFSLHEPALIRRGFRHFETGCAPCHGAPGAASSLGTGLLPPAPDLATSVPDWSPAQLFWIVKHGIKMTGMPAWEAQERDDEVWAVVAFLLKLPQVTAEEYRAMSQVHADAGSSESSAGGSLIALAGPPGRSEAACARCHGMNGTGEQAGAFPRIDGQSEDYLYESLNAYASGARPSGIMGPAARALTHVQRRAVAAHYAGQSVAPDRSGDSRADPLLLQKGGALAAVGAPERNVQACNDCHARQGPGRAQNYPFLAGQSVRYLAEQLELWRAGRRDRDAGSVMEGIARGMSPDEIKAVSAYFAALRPAAAGKEAGAAEAAASPDGSPDAP